MISVKYTTWTDGASARGNRINKSLAAPMALGLATAACTGYDNADMSAAPEKRHCRSRRTSRGRQRAHAPAALMADGQACHPGQDGILRKRAPYMMPP